MARASGNNGKSTLASTARLGAAPRPRIAKPARGPQEPGKPPGARDLLLAAARSEFAVKGYDGARIDEIAARAGVNKQIIYYYFGNKDDLFRATLEHIYEGIREQNLRFVQNVKPMAPEIAIRGLVDHLFGRLHEHQDVIALVLEENRYKGRHLVDKKLIHSSHVPMFDYLAKILAEGERSGIFVEGIDPRQFFFDMISLCMFFFINVYTMSAVLKMNLLSREAMQARRKHIADRLLASLTCTAAARRD